MLCRTSDGESTTLSPYPLSNARGAQVERNLTFGSFSNGRRNMPAYSITRNREEEDDDDVFLRDIFGKKPEEIVPRHRASSHDSLPSARSRSISIQPGGGLGVGAQRDSPSRLTPLVEEKPLTEAENNEKYGHKVKITVVMVLDPRIEVNASNQASVKVYTSGYPVDMRAVSSCTLAICRPLHMRDAAKLMSIPSITSRPLRFALASNRKRTSVACSKRLPPAR